MDAYINSASKPLSLDFVMTFTLSFDSQFLDVSPVNLIIIIRICVNVLFLARNVYITSDLHEHMFKEARIE